MSDGVEFYIGTIILWAGTKIPKGWFLCNGSQYPIGGEHAALYAVIGNTYGGTGNMFAVPDLRGRFPIGAGTAAANTGETLPLGNIHANRKQVTLTVRNLPPHQHTFRATFPKTLTGEFTIPANDSGSGLTDKPGTNTVLAKSTTNSRTPGGDPYDTSIYTTAPANVQMPGGTITLPTQGMEVGIDPIGNGDPIDIMPSYLAMNYIICSDGVFPLYE